MKKSFDLTKLIAVWKNKILILNSFGLVFSKKNKDNEWVKFIILLLCLPSSNACVERLFLSYKLIKTDIHYLFVPLLSRYHPVSVFGHRYSPSLTITPTFFTVYVRPWPFSTVFFTAFNRFYSLPSDLIDLRTINNP